MNHHLLTIFWSNIKLGSNSRVKHPFATSYFFGMNIRVWIWMIPVFVYKKYRVKDLMGSMCVHGCHDMCDVSKVFINKFTQANIIFNCAIATTPTDKQFEIWNAKCILYINQQ